MRQQYKEIYWAWKSMKQRTMNEKCAAYRNYGARGIRVCDEWMEFEPFLKWSLKSGWSKSLDIDRIDNNRGYSPDNCRWITRKENINNRRNTLFITVDGRRLSCSEWETLTGIPRGSLKVWRETKGEDYVAGRISDALENGYVPKDYGYGSRKKVMHVQSGIVFDSVREAADYFGIAPCTISNSIREHRETGKGRFDYEVV